MLSERQGLFLDDAQTMATINVLRLLSAPGVLGGILLCHTPARAQQELPARLTPNEQVLQTWQQSNLGGAVPSLTREDDGSTRLEWTGGLTVDAYRNSIQSASGTLTTPLRSGDFQKSTFTSDLRALRKNNVVDYFQIGATSSDDLSVLSQHPYQFNNFQIGRTGDGYALAFGDIALNFSSLGSSIGVRGAYGQHQFGPVTLQAFGGQVAESWEVLANSVPSNQYLKAVHGLKVEQTFGSALRAYVTAQASTERTAPTMAQPATAALGATRSVSAGFQYQQDQFNLTGETAGSNFEDDGNANRRGRATVIDGTWRTGQFGWRVGHHDIGSGFTSLSVAAQAGILETYAGVDWTAAPWVSFASDIRNSTMSTLASDNMASTSSRSDSAALRANINFEPNHPGWALALQQSTAKQLDSAAQASQRRDSSATVNYASPLWNAGLTYGVGRNVSATSPTSDSLTDNWSLTVARMFSDAAADLPQSWSAGLNFAATSQTQRLLMTGNQTRDTNYTLAFTGRRSGWGSVNLLLSGGVTSQPSGAPSLRMQGVQLDALYPLQGQSSVKAFVRSTRRNIADPLLAVAEIVAGLQLVYNYQDGLQ